jgi:hypothetical protein
MWKYPLPENLFKYGKLQAFEETKPSIIIHCLLYQSENAVILFNLLERLQGLLHTILNGDRNAAGKAKEWRSWRLAIPIFLLSYAFIPPDLISIRKQQHR